MTGGLPRMVIYYTHRFNQAKGESHRLLAKAIEEWLSAKEYPAAGCSTAADEAVRLTASMQTAGGFGKPFIRNFPPFSISHSDRTWAVLIAQSPGERDICTAPSNADTSVEKPTRAANIYTNASENDNAERSVTACGLDVQYVHNADYAAIAKRFFDTADAEKVHHAASFFRLWVRREALVKAAGTSVAETDIPSVSADRAVYSGTEYRIIDITIPGAEDLYSAICIDCKGGGSEEYLPEIVTIEL